MNISITQALSELKLLDTRINRGINQTDYCVGYMNGTKINGTLTPNEVDSIVKSIWQSVNDLIKRRANIKSKIVSSNATTQVDIGDDKMTVAEAIERKGSIVYEQKLLEKLKMDYLKTQKVITQGNEQARQKAQTSLDTVLGKEGSKNASEQDVASVYDPVFHRYEYKLQDPISISKQIEDLQIRIENFLNNVDFELSTSNATTIIEVS